MLCSPWCPGELQGAGLPGWAAEGELCGPTQHRDRLNTPGDMTGFGVA